MTTQIRESIVIDASPEQVWRFFTTQAEVTALLPTGVRLELLSTRMDEVGCSWLTVTEAGGRRREVLNEVLEVEPFQTQLLRSSSANSSGTTRTTLIPHPIGTELVLEATAEWQPGIGAFVNRILTSLLGHFMTRQALKKIKRRVETS